MRHTAIQAHDQAQERNQYSDPQHATKAHEASQLLNPRNPTEETEHDV